MIDHADKNNGLTGREREVLLCLKQGMTSRNIAATLGITERTVKFHVGHILGKMNVRNRTQAVAVAMDRGLFQ